MSDVYVLSVEGWVIYCMCIMCIGAYVVGVFVVFLWCLCVVVSEGIIVPYLYLLLRREIDYCAR